MEDIKQPLVSIIIPMKEDRGYLDKAIDSVWAQTYENIELLLSESSNGVSYNLNRGIERAKGEFVKYLCDDDLLIKDSVKNSVDAMRNVDFIHGRALNLFQNGTVDQWIPPVQYPTLQRMIEGNVIHGGSLMYRRDVFDRFGMFDESLWTGEEYDFNMMLLSKGAKIGYCNKDLYIYRRHDAQKSLGKSANQSLRKVEMQKIRERYAKI